jgi:ABC-type polysaccharide/polyol phosphate transport system ATPase subunit
VTASVIEVRGVSKSFTIPSVRRDTVREHALDFFRRRTSERLRVLESVTFELRRGESLGLMGRNGSGKSTLLKIVSGIYPADAGAVQVHAPVTPILELGVGWNPDLDAVDNIELLGTVMGMTLKELRVATPEILQFAELEKFAHLELRHYSSGMAARLAYAVAFRAVRDVLILDEIFAVGDAGFKERCQARYRDLHRTGHSLLLVSHEPRTIAAFCDRALLLEGGRIVMSGAAAAVADRYLALLTEPEPAGLKTGIAPWSAAR